MRTVLIVVDGMRPDAIAAMPRVQKLLKNASYTMTATTVLPSVTLPCHMSLFHSVDPSRHGTTTNTYAPQVRPINGLCEVLLNHKKTCAFFYNWEELRDLARPNSLSFSCYCKGGDFGYDKANTVVTNAAIAYLTANYTDFAFLYLGYSDEAGHSHGWMSQEYMAALENSWDNIGRVIDALPEDYTVIITADHGGHDRMHGTDLPEDMTIPVIVMGNGFAAGKDWGTVTIKDLAPTIAKLLEVEPDADWEGRSLI